MTAEILLAFALLCAVSLTVVAVSAVVVGVRADRAIQVEAAKRRHPAGKTLR